MNTTYGVLNNSSLIVDTDKLRENVRTILRSLPAGTKLIPVVKDDAYGMGMVGVARTLSAFPEIGCFAVANVSEGVTLRREGIRQDILIMGSTLPFQYAPAVECDLTVTVSRLGMVPELAEVCKAQSKPLNVQIKLETGMHRIGVEPGEELAALIGELKAAQEWVHVTGAFSHFAWPGNAEVCEAQYKKLLAGAEQLKAAGIPVPMCHISASESSELFPQYALDAVRIGRRLPVKALVRHQLQRLARRAVEPREIKQLIQRLGHEDLELKLLCQRGKRVRIPLSVQKEENIAFVQKRMSVWDLRLQFLPQMPLPHVRIMVGLKIDEGEGQRVEIRQVSAGRL